MSTESSQPQTHLDFGITWRAVRSFLPSGFIMGALALVLGLIGRHFGLSEGPVNSFACFGLLLTPVFVMALAILPTLLLTIQIRGGQVMNVFAGRYILSQHPLTDFRGHRLSSRGCAAVLEFAGGYRMHIFAITPSELARLLKALNSR